MARARMPGRDILQGIGAEERANANAGGSSYRYDAAEAKRNRDRQNQDRIAARKTLEGVSDKAAEKRRKANEKSDRELAKERLLQDAQLREANRKDWQERIKEEHKALKENLKQQQELLKLMKDEGLKGTEEYAKQMQTVNDAMVASTNAALKDFASSTVKELEAVAKNITNSMDEYLTAYQKYYSSINTRLQGAYDNLDFESISKDIASTVGYSSYVRYTAVLEELEKLVERGTAYNLEERAFLSSISDKIATTFDVLDDTLLRIVRLQQTDTTAGRLGMEASLTRLFNYYFSDTSYLSDAFDSVTNALLGLTSSLDAFQAVEYEYTIQKWLGALGSAGADTSTINSIATALNALSTGDIATLQSNESMNRLLIQAANRAGLNYGSLLTTTPTQQELNMLLYEMITFIQETMEGANNVVKSSYASIYGITYADIQAFENISGDMLDELYASSMTYADTLTELNYQLNEVANSRTSIAERVNNVLDNILADTALTMFNSQAMYTTWAVADMVEKITGGIAIPTVGVMGNFVGWANSIEELMKIGLTGTSLMVSMFGGFSDWLNADALNLSNWNWNYSKGDYTGYTSANLTTLSSSNIGTVSNSSELGIQQAMYDAQYAEAEAISGTTLTTEESILDVVADIRDYLEDGGSSTTPLMVEPVQKQKTNTVTTSTSTTSGSDTILAALNTIIEVLSGRPTGENGNEVYVRNTRAESTATGIQSLLSGLIPGSTF